MVLADGGFLWEDDNADLVPMVRRLCLIVGDVLGGIGTADELVPSSLQSLMTGWRARLSYESRPEELNEVTMRPLDAYGALAYLRSRRDIVADRIALQGWSNGGSAALATMSVTAPGIASPTPASGFRGALVFYPACGLKGHFDNGLLSYAPVRVFQGSADEEVSSLA